MSSLKSECLSHCFMVRYHQGYAVDADSLPGKMRCKDFILLLCSLIKVSFSDIKSLGLVFIGAVDLNRKIKVLEDYQKGELLLLALRFVQRRIYLVNDTGKGMPIEYITLLKYQMEKLASSGRLNALAIHIPA